MPFWVYILKSDSCNRYYCGSTENLERRVNQHNDPVYTLTKTTKNFPGPWELVWSGRRESRTEALTKEKQIKKPIRSLKELTQRDLQRLHHVMIYEVKKSGSKP